MCCILNERLKNDDNILLGPMRLIGRNTLKPN